MKKLLKSQQEKKFWCTGPSMFYLCPKVIRYDRKTSSWRQRAERASFVLWPGSAFQEAHQPDVLRVKSPLLFIKMTQLRCLGSRMRCLLDYAGHSPLQGDPRLDQELTERTLNPLWSGNPFRFPRKLECAAERCLSHNLTSGDYDWNDWTFRQCRQLSTGVGLVVMVVVE